MIDIRKHGSVVALAAKQDEARRLTRAMTEGIALRAALDLPADCVVSCARVKPSGVLMEDRAGHIVRVTATGAGVDDGGRVLVLPLPEFDRIIGQA